MRKTAVTPLSPLALPPLLARHWLGRPHAPRHVGSPRVASQPRRKLRCLDIRCDAPLSNRTHHAQPPCPAIRGPYPVGASLAADRLGLHGWAAGHLRRLESRPASDQTRSQPRMIRRGWLGRPHAVAYTRPSPRIAGTSVRRGHIAGGCRMMRAFGPCALVGPSGLAGSRVFAVVWVRVSVFRWGVSGTLYTVGFCV